MPHLNRSLSSPSLRDPSKSVLDEFSSRTVHSMSHPRPPSSRSSSIRSFSARRPRPSVASIADIFVSSLVLAGFCHEHSPRGRGLSTLALRASETDVRRPRRRDGALHGESAVQKQWQFSGLSVHQSQPRSWFSQGLAQVEHLNLEKQGPDPEIEQRPNESDEHIPSRFPEVSGQSSQYHFYDTIPAGYRLAISSPRSLICFRPRELTPSERKRLRAAAFFQRLLGNRYWGMALDVAIPPKKRPFRPDGTRNRFDIESVEVLFEALKGSIRGSRGGTQYLFNLYRNIPAPGVAYLSKTTREKLLAIFATSPNRRWVDSRRYLALVDDMIKCNLPMSLHLWTSAIYMAGRSHHGRLSRRRMVRAIGMWQKMEHQAGIRADDVVFNILFDIAIKANHYTVADRLEEEMQTRGIEFSRSGLVSKIYSCGMRRDLKGIRDNFEKFTQQGQLVDTVVLNCLMAAFLRAGDMDTAEQLYGRMIKAQIQQNESAKPSREPPSEDNKARLSPEFTHYRSKNRELGRLLTISSRLQKSLPDCHKVLQHSLPMTPDSRTFYIWLQHCTHSGDLDMFMNVLRDMERTFEVPPRHIIYMLLFQGFGLHGGRKKRRWDSEKKRWISEKQRWTSKKLRLTWLSFLSAVRDSRARQEGQPRKYPISWENPLRDLDAEYNIAASERSSDPHELYMNLPIGDPESLSPSPQEKSQIRPRSNLDEEYALDGEEFEEDIADANLDAEEIFLSSAHHDIDETEPDGQTINYISARLENGVFVGRSMTINILRAFGACCGPDEVQEAWMQLEAFWPLHKRKANDMLAVDQVLEEELSRQSFNPHSRKKEKTHLEAEREPVATDSDLQE
ncbi:hypothetical protein N7493_012099 [Penicillium malachiteum]|uniref:Pentatricopeptide repeat protein n=1 Tax=Penicillium malachiteum TaxID=1324776 RepID=A0AAD6H9V5_9EURO|nr:hypothetical protein N7493_012099 [Penicillium malachiteum]